MSGNPESSVRSPPQTVNTLIMHDMERLRISALTRAAALSPLVREVTIGPNSPQTKRNTFADTQSLIPPPDDTRERKIKDRISREDRIYLEHARRYDAALAKESNAIFEDMLKRMAIRRAEFAEKLKRQQAIDAERNDATLRKHIQEMLNAWRYNDPAVINNLPVSEEPENRGSRTIENMNRIIEEQNVIARLSAIRESHATVSSTFDEISEILHDDHAKPLFEKYMTALNSIISNMNNVLEICSNGAVMDKDVKLAQVLSLNIVNLKTKALEYIDAKKAEEKTKRDKQLEYERVKKENELRLQKEKKEQENLQKSELNQAETQKHVAKPVARTKPMFYTEKNYANYQQLKRFLENYEASSKNLASDPSQKTFCFDCRKAVNVPVNSLCSVSGHHMKDKYEQLSMLIRGERVQVMDTIVCASQHPQGIAYCTALLAKKLVNQGHLTVSSNPEAAYPLASVIISLWSKFGDLGTLIEANFQRECPYLVPMFLPQQDGQSKQDFLKSLGYLYDEDGTVEKQDKFLKRMSGIFRLCCAVWITKPTPVMTGQNPHGMEHAWKWLSSFVNLKPESQISATLLFDYFTVCGNQCMKTYGRQFTKVIKLICTHYLPILDKIDEGGPKTRLEVLLQNILQTGNIPPPSGILPPNVW